MTEQKIESKYIDKIQELTNKQNEFVFKLGEISLNLIGFEEQIKLLQTQKQDVMTDFKFTQEQFAELNKEMTEQYGEGQIDIEKGVFISKS